MWKSTFTDPKLSGALLDLTTISPISILIVLIGYGISIFVGHLYSWIIIETIYAYIRRESGPGFPGVNCFGHVRKGRPYGNITGIIGVIERAIYTTGVLAAQEKVIALWLALKIAGQWAAWNKGSGEVERGSAQQEGRAIFNMFLVGNGLSLIFGGGTALLIKRFMFLAESCINPNLLDLASLVALLLFPLLIWVYLWISVDRQKPAKIVLL